MFTRRLRPEHPHAKKILYVEDEPDIQAIAKVALETIGGFTVRICSSGREALETIEEFNPDCILLDVMMPGMDGPTTLKALRRLPGFAATPAIFMTAKGRPVAEYKALGALDMITKPFNPMTLASTLRRILEGRQ
jgi:CheY-like chemotaxis protein